LWEIVMALSVLVTVLVGWFARIVWVKSSKIEARSEAICNRVAKLELKLAEEYVSVVTFKDSIREFKQDMTDHTKAIYEKLDRIDAHFMSQKS
jgi:hypothetical protein